MRFAETHSMPMRDGAILRWRYYWRMYRQWNQQLENRFGGRVWIDDPDSAESAEYDRINQRAIEYMLQADAWKALAEKYGATDNDFHGYC